MTPSGAQCSMKPGPNIPSSVRIQGGMISPGWAMLQRMASMRMKPMARKSSPKKPYCAPMTLWSVLKTYFFQNESSWW